MRDFELIKALVGADVTVADLKYVDCYVHQKLGVFIPSMGACGYASRNKHTHPAIMVAIFFTPERLGRELGVTVADGEYYAEIISPDIPHDDVPGADYYCVMIDPEYFSSQYRLYRDEVPVFRWEAFTLSADVLRIINTFAMEYTAGTGNADITLDAQATLLVHWIIRSLLGGRGYSRTLSANCLVARAQHYIELHYPDPITVGELAGLEHMSDSGFTRLFKRETGLTPIRYLTGIRLEKAKELLRRGEVPITEVGALCGFGSSTHFASEFRRLAGVSPSKYRDAYRR